MERGRCVKEMANHMQTRGLGTIMTGLGRELLGAFAELHRFTE